MRLPSASSHPLALLLFCCAVVTVVGCGTDPAEPVQGQVQIGVYDNGDVSKPVAGVRIRVLPVDRVVETNAEGLAVFDLPPGEYELQAAVCCIGPGFIEYEESATVTAGRTTSVAWSACLACL